MMGLGITLQGIALIWVMLKKCKITEVTRAKKCIVVCPASLLFHWEKEVNKWLGPHRIGLVVCQGGKKEVVYAMNKFINEDRINMLVCGYDCFRIYGHNLTGTADLMICDEGHKIKNRKINTSKALNACSTKRRVILTGTPIQNCLNEFFTLVDFINPGIFVSYSKFKRVYTDTI